VITDDREWPGYGNTSFGGSFDRILSGWISAHFRVAARVTIPPHTTIDGPQSARTLVVWLRRGA
jgi:hypothetical protein